MKRKGNIYRDIIALENLYRASQKAQRGKRHKKDIIEWNKDLWANLQQLQDELQNKTYRVSEYTIFTIKEPKERIISKLPFKDRVVHHAIMLQIEHILEASFVAHTYSCIKKRGVHKGLRDLNKALENRQATKYCLKLDIKKFYPSVDHYIVKAALRRKFKDEDLLWLLDLIILSHEGLPLGNFTSQWLGNLYLSPFCHWLKSTETAFIYCDDIVILHSDKQHLYELKHRIINYLKTNLKLELSNYQVFPVSKRSIDFLGYCSDHDKIRVRKRIKESFRRNTQSAPSYMGWTKHGNCRNLEHKILQL